MKSIAAFILLAASIIAAAAGLEVRKSASPYPELENAYTVTLEYNIPLGEDETAETAKRHDITIRDTVPEEFVLVEGALVKRVKSVVPGEWQKFAYVIKAANDVTFTLDETKKTVRLPRAYFEIFADDTETAEVVENNQTETVDVTLKLHTPSPVYYIPEIPYISEILSAAIFVVPVFLALFFTKVFSARKPKTN